MTLNFSPRPTFPAQNPSNGDFLSSLFRETGSEGLGWSHCFNQEFDETYNCGRDRAVADRIGSCEPPVYNDIADLLPADPFGMELSTTWTAAIAGWIEDLVMDGHYMGDCGRDIISGDCQFVADFSYLCNRALWFPPDTGLNCASEADIAEKELPEVPINVPCSNVIKRVQDLEEIFPSFGRFEVEQCMNIQAEESGGHAVGSCSGGDGRSTPHEAMLFSFAYLGVRDLLSAEMVCKTFHSAVQNDPLLWRCIHIDGQLSERITDVALLRLTERAQGSLECLSLVECSKITDDGLKHVLANSSKLRKLSVPGCKRLTVDNLVKNLRIFKSSGVLGIKHLKIGGLYGIKHEHFEELRLLLGLNNCQQPKACKPQFYHTGFSSSFDDETIIDIDICPKCQKVRLVYDCPAESCQGSGSQQCRACSFCVARCVQCGRCIEDTEYEETFSLDFLCLSCLNDVLQSQERRKVEIQL